MLIAQSVTFWLAAVAYVVATFMVFAGIAFKRERYVKRSMIATGTGLIAHVAAIGVRWVLAGHFPFVGNYEGVLFGSALTVATWLVLVAFVPRVAVANALVMPAVLVSMGYGLTQPSTVSPVTPPYQSPWLLLHFSFAWSAYALFVTVAGLAVVELIRARARKRGAEPRGVPAWVPETEKVEDISLRLVALGFLLDAVCIVTGSIWAYRLWGSYWAWDPVETWTLATWLAYGFYLHARLTLGWKGPRLAWVALIALFGMAMATWGVQFVPTSYHLFKDIGGSMFQSRPQ